MSGKIYTSLSVLKIFILFIYINLITNLKQRDPHLIDSNRTEVSVTM